MKLLIASDLHGSALWAGFLRELYEQHRPQRIILLGDLLYHGPRNDLPDEYAPAKVSEILNKMKDRIIAVRGNCDSEVDQMMLSFPCMADSAMLFVDGYSIHVTHGHLLSPQNPPPMAPGDILLTGHTHIGIEQPMGRYVFLNPGSLALPKDGHHSYMIYEDGVFIRISDRGNTLGSWSMSEDMPDHYL